jgi:malate dehydrogenase (oxaloacetate-decarboxylating)
MKLAAARAIAAAVRDNELHADSIVPSVFDRDVAPAVARAVAQAAVASGVAGQPRPSSNRASGLTTSPCRSRECRRP